MDLKDCIAGTPVKIHKDSGKIGETYGHIVRFDRNCLGETIILLMMETGDYRSIHPANISRLE